MEGAALLNALKLDTHADIDRWIKMDNKEIVSIKVFINARMWIWSDENANQVHSKWNH
jgi:hypothetical protein